ncbi:hypothetical protein DDQ68_10245 [Hymenobacter nivis]|uniref:Uncharacterized protein n=1 Tax=Hymenobacter nivis TaxID=1850093 RepID=A0A2Z3GLZ8_9BACT|nr:hypothetical protein DDQ68_10245 [Hymenobacter nivis]
MFLLGFLACLGVAPHRTQAQPILPPAARADSLAARPAGLPSQVVLRLDYAARVLFAGRDYGVRQSATTPSLLYNHRSGAYAGVSGGFYSQASPSYVLTDFSLGYGNLLGSKLLYNVSYDRYFYNASGSAVLANTGGLLLSYDFGPLSLGSSYAFLFGDGQTGHRLVPSLSGYQAWKHLGFIDKLFVLPSLSAIIGTENTSYQIFSPKVVQAAKAKKTKKTAAAPITEQVNDFGLMGWNLALPVKARIGHLTLGATYNYALPIKLPHEDDEAGFGAKSFVSFSLSYSWNTSRQGK